jgi:hypothetical protein
LAKARQHAETAYYDLAGTFTANTTDILSFVNSGANDWITFTGNKTRFKVWQNGVGLAEFQALTFFGSGAGLTSTTVPTAALVDGADLPSSDQKAALAGSSGTPSSTNKYVTDADARNTDARTPAAHAASHQHGGSDAVATSTPAANAIPKADATGRFTTGWQTIVVATADQGYFHAVSIWPAFSTANTAAFTAEQHKVWQFVLPFAATVQHITFDIQTGSGTCAGTCHLNLGIWDAGCTTMLVSTGIMSSGGTPNINAVAQYTVTVASPVTLNPGVYWLGMTTDSAALILHGLSLASRSINQINGQTAKRMGIAANAGSAGAFPASCGAVTASTAVPPIVTFER